jgi:hypothetical protein
MKNFILLSLIATMILSASDCGKKEKALKGKLEIKALCMNYTIRLVEGDLDTSLIVSSWTDETTGKSYNNVFKLGSPCNFPSTIKEGDEFYFKIDTAVQNCAVCMAYYPTPPKRLSIKVIEK